MPTNPLKTRNPFIPPPPKTLNTLLPFNRNKRSNNPYINHYAEPINLMKKRKIDETHKMSAKSKDLLEVWNGYEIVNVDKMYNSSDGVVDDGGLVVDDITIDESY